MKLKLELTPTLVFWLLLIIFMSSCHTPKELEYKTFKNFKSDKIDISNATFKLDIVYFNPNNFGLELRNTDLDIYIDDNYLGHTQQDYQIHIPKKREFSVPIKIAVDMKNAYKNALPALWGKEVMLKITGKVRVGKANIFKNFKVNYQSKQKFSF